MSIATPALQSCISSASFVYAQVEKAQRREETVAVAVVTLTQVGNVDKYLLLQRPKDGLLAGEHRCPI